MSGVLLAVAPNGARRGKADHPRLPVSIDETARCAAECAAAGAGMIHLHVRDARGRHTLDAGLYRKAIDAVREKASEDLIIQITTESAGVFEPPAQMRAALEARAEAASVALRELCPDEKAETQFFRFLERCAAIGVHVQHILYTPEEIRRFAAFIDKGRIPQARPALLAVVGRYASPAAGGGGVAPYIEAAEGLDGVEKMACGFGSGERQILLRAAAKGWHVRTGFENTLQQPDGAAAADNAALVRALAADLIAQGQKALSPREARTRLLAEG